MSRKLVLKNSDCCKGYLLTNLSLVIIAHVLCGTTVYYTNVSLK